MKHLDHLALIQNGVITGTSTHVDRTFWAELGSGRGAFTLALADILDSQGHILSVDKDLSALKEQERQMKVRFPQAKVQYMHANFTEPLSLNHLDGILMANSLHFIKDKEPFLERIQDYLKPGGRFILVEYNVDHGNIWVPYPLSFQSWQSLARKAGFVETRLLETRRSSFLGGFYAALSFRKL